MHEEHGEGRKAGARMLTLAEAIGELRFEMGQRRAPDRHHAGADLYRCKMNVNKRR